MLIRETSRGELGSRSPPAKKRASSPATRASLLKLN